MLKTVWLKKTVVTKSTDGRINFHLKLGLKVWISIYGCGIG